MASEAFHQLLEQMRANREAAGAGPPYDPVAMRPGMSQAMFPVPEGVSLTTASANGVPSEWVVADGASSANRLVYLHGGGYVGGGLDSHRHLSAGLSHASGCAVLAVDYRLAPEHPHPAAVEDAVAAYQFARERGPNGAGAANRIFIGGDSAGGGLTLATLLALKEQGIPLPDAAFTISAWTDLAATGDSMRSRAEVDPMIDGDMVRTLAAAYCGNLDARTPAISPLYGDLAGLPPLYMVVGDAEVLLDDTLRVAERARAAGVEVTCEAWPEMVHVWPLLAPAIPEGQEAVAKLGAFLKAHSVA